MSSSPEQRRTPSGCGLPGEVAADLAAAGFDLAGVLAIERYDALVAPAWRSAALLPGARSAVVLGCGGRAFEGALEATPGADEGPHPVDAFARRHAEHAAGALAARGVPARALFYWQALPDDDPQGGEFADFVALARAAGLGEPGRLRLLLHPEFGPWMALRALLLCGLELEPTPPLGPPSPCTECAAPCVSACPGGALDDGPLDFERCLETRERVGACQSRCAARHACVLGPSHAYTPRWEAHFMRTALRKAGSLKRNPQSDA